MATFESFRDDLATARRYRRTALSSEIALHLYAEYGHIGTC